MLSLARWTLFCYCLFTDELIARESVTDNDNIYLLVGELHTKARCVLDGMLDDCSFPYDAEHDITQNELLALWQFQWS